MSSKIKTNFYRNKRYRDATLKAKLTRKEKELKSKPIPSEFKDRIAECPSPWKVFFRQNDAFEFARNVSQNVHVFSYESDMFTGQTGQRLYLATSYEKFWHYYRQLEPDRRHHYEVIPEGAVCKLYFDLEFNRQANDSVCGNTLVDIFIKYVCTTLREYLNIECGKDDIMILDATTPVKFSQHLIFILKNAAFQNNIEAGWFVRLVCSNILATIDIVKNEKVVCLSNANEVDVTANATQSLGSKECSCSFKHEEDRTDDLCEHEHDEPKRMSLDCAEGGKTVNMVNSDSVDTVKNMQAGLCSKCVNESLIKTLKDTCLSISELSSLVVKDKEGKEILFCDTGVYTKNRNFRLYLSSKLSKRVLLTLAETNTYQPQCEKNMTFEQQLFLDSLVHNISYTEKLTVLTLDGGKDVQSSRVDIYRNSANTNIKEANLVSGYSSSPYPEIDKFVSTVINKGGVQGYIRRFTYFPQGELVIYDIGKNRWCENIGRPHKSNNILIVADLLKKEFYQKCHDPDCKAVNFKSEEKELPRSVLPSTYVEEEFEESEEVSDEALLLAANIAVQSGTSNSCGNVQTSMLTNHEQSKEDTSADMMEEDNFDIDDNTLIQSVEQMDSWA